MDRLPPPLSPLRLRLLVPIVVLLSLGPALQAGWFWDDVRLILHNPVVHDLDWAAAVGRHLWWGVTGDQPEGLVYWRPLVLLSFLVDHALGWGAPGAHLQSVLWHVAAVVGVQAAASQRWGAVRGAVAALLFGLHPAAVESVAWVAARNDAMAGALGIGAVALGGPVGGALALLACGAKESAYLLPAFAWAWGTPRARWVLGGVAVAVALRLGLQLPQPTLPPSWAGTPTALLQLFGQAWAPWPLTSVAWVPALRLSAGLGAAGLVGVALFGAVARRALREGLPLVGLLPLLALLPGVVPIASTQLTGERFLYLPLLWLAVAGAPLLERRRLPLAGAVVLAWLLVLGLRLGEWTSEERLLRAAAARSPSSLVYARLGLILEGEGRTDEALEAYGAGLRLRPAFTRTCARPLRLLQAGGRGPEAEAWTREFAEVCP